MRTAVADGAPIAAAPSATRSAELAPRTTRRAPIGVRAGRATRHGGTIAFTFQDPTRGIPRRSGGRYIVRPGAALSSKRGSGSSVRRGTCAPPPPPPSWDTGPKCWGFWTPCCAITKRRGRSFPRLVTICGAGFRASKGGARCGHGSMCSPAMPHRGDAVRRAETGDATPSRKSPRKSPTVSPSVRGLLLRGISPPPHGAGSARFATPCRTATARSWCFGSTGSCHGSISRWYLLRK